MEYFIVLILLHVGNLADPPLERSFQELISPSFDTILYKDGHTLGDDPVRDIGAKFLQGYGGRRG